MLTAKIKKRQHQKLTAKNFLLCLFESKHIPVDFEFDHVCLGVDFQEFQNRIRQEQTITTAASIEGFN